jgi:hypothetical protein
MPVAKTLSGLVVDDRECVRDREASKQRVEKILGEVS